MRRNRKQVEKRSTGEKNVPKENKPKTVLAKEKTTTSPTQATAARKIQRVGSTMVLSH